VSEQIVRERTKDERIAYMQGYYAALRWVSTSPAISRHVMERIEGHALTVKGMLDREDTDA
jgi:hypothetical protein